jgi:hypothetical protein
MERMGHSSPRAALIYLHATRERDQKIAAGMGRLFVGAKTTSTKRTGTGEAIGHATGTPPQADTRSNPRELAINRPDLA